jgi:hypothetical protein
LALEANGRLKDLRTLASAWRVPDAKQLDQKNLIAQLRTAFKDKQAAKEIVSGLSTADRGTLDAYCRYGTGLVSGVVMRMDLLARGLLQIHSQTISDRFVYHRWEREPTQRLAERAFLIRPSGLDRYGNSTHGGYGRETETPLPTFAINPILAQCLKPAGPPSWPVPAAENVVSLGKPRSSAEVAFELSRVFATLAGRKSWRLNRSGELSTPARNSLTKAVSLGEDRDFPHPEKQAFHFELLRRMGAVKTEIENAHADQAAAQAIFSRPAWEQARLWATAWLHAECWSDGFGSTNPEVVNFYYAFESSLSAQRQILAWALSCLAHQGDQWLDLKAFVERIEADGGTAAGEPYGGGGSTKGWDPKFVDRKAIYELDGEERRHGFWLASHGTWFANAVMVTLATLGFIERGSAQGAGVRYCFRLTPLGRAIFGAPEVEPPTASTGQFLVVQPNFDVVAYLDQTDAQGIGSLGLLLENLKPTLGPVQTFRITHEAFYRALELGLSYERAIELLQQASQHALPANVLQTLQDWSARRESMIVRRKVILLGFASPNERDAYLAKGAGRACGDRWVIVDAGQKLSGHALDGALKGDKDGGQRPLVVNEQGIVSHQGPLDTFQIGRLHHFAELRSSEWRITPARMKSAVEQGLKPALVIYWLSDMLAEPIPPLLEHALLSWTGKPESVKLGSALVLQVPDPELFEIISQSELFRPMLQGSLETGWLMVRPECAKELARLLADYGFAVTTDLTPGKLPPVRGDLG